MNKEDKEVALYELFDNYLDAERKIDIDTVVTILMQVKSTTDMIKESSELNGIKIVDFPMLISSRRAHARMSAVKSSVDKIAVSISNNDIKAIAKTLTQTTYFLIETFIEYGMQDKYTILMKALHNSKMSKHTDKPYDFDIKGIVDKTPF